MKIYKIANKSKYEIVDNGFNRANYPDMIGEIVDTPPAYAQVKLIKKDKVPLETILRLQNRISMDNRAENMPQDFVMKALGAGYGKDEIIQSLGSFYGQADEPANSIFTKAVSKLKGYKIDHLLNN